MRVKDWKYIFLDSGHWIASYNDQLESPIHWRKSWVKRWVSAYVSKQKKTARAEEWG